MILLAVLALSLIVALARGGRFSQLEHWQPLHGWLPGLALLIQVLVVVLHPPSSGAVVALLGLSLALLLTFTILNRRLPGMTLLGLGLALNLAAIAANGGWMPVSPAALERAGLHQLAALPEGSLLQGSKDILLKAEHARLWWLGDIIPLPPPIAVVLSVGDLLAAAGGGWFWQRAMFPRPATDSK